MSVIVWHKMYQVLCDLKLLFFFNEQYDDIISPSKKRGLPTIAFVIPSYQEPFSVAKMTFDSIVNTPYAGRKEIIVVDNSKNLLADFYKWEAYVENFNLNYPEKNISAKFIYNDERNTLKPGNLDLAQQFIEEGEFVVFLDVDSTLPSCGKLLERAVADFYADDTLGFIQFRIKATNAHFNSLTQAIAVSQDLLRLRMISRGYGGYKIFEGHNGIWRKTLLDELGSWVDYYRGNIIITEDILKTTQVYNKGFYGKPLNVETGEWVPSSLKAFESMWMRWMYGNSQVFFKYFRKIYSGETSLIEKFDISFHVLHHFVTLFSLIVVMLLQLLVPGNATNIFIFSLGVIPGIIAAITGFVTTGDKSDWSLIRKLQYNYAGFFLIETFITTIQIKSDIKFILRRPEGWKVTEKGLENFSGWRSFFFSNLFYIRSLVLSLLICCISWIYNYGMNLHSIVYHLGLLFGSVNLLLCLVIFGKQGRKLANRVESKIMITEEVL